MDEIKTLEEFENLIKLSKKTPILIDFYANWCFPCKVLTPTLEKIEKVFEGKFKLVKINVEDFPEISMEFGIMGIPTVVLLKDGNEIDRFVGVRNEKEIVEWLKENNVI